MSEKHECDYIFVDGNKCSNVEVDNMLAEECEAANSKNNKEKIENYKKAMNLSFMLEQAFKPYILNLF